MTIRKMHYSSLTVKDSPVEFLLAGPKGNRSGILIRSDNLKTDLIGFAVRERDQTNRIIYFGTLLKVYLGWSARRMYSVKSLSLKTQDPDSGVIHGLDDRKSVYKFCWRGDCTSYDIIAIERIFNLYIEDVLKGLNEKDDEFAEWSIAPIILCCSEAMLRKQWRRRFSLVFLGIYSVSALVFLFMTVTHFYG